MSAGFLVARSFTRLARSANRRVDNVSSADAMAGESVAISTVRELPARRVQDGWECARRARASQLAVESSRRAMARKRRLARFEAACFWHLRCAASPERAGCNSLVKVELRKGTCGLGSLAAKACEMRERGCVRPVR